MYLQIFPLQVFIAMIIEYKDIIRTYIVSLIIKVCTYSTDHV